MTHYGGKGTAQELRVWVRTVPLTSYVTLCKSLNFLGKLLEKVYQKLYKKKIENLRSMYTEKLNNFKKNKL